MTCCENTKLNKVISLFVSICFLFCVLVSPATVPKAHAMVGVGTVVTVSSVLAVAAVLVACGISVSVGDVSFKSFCESIVKALNLPIAIQQKVVLGVGYLTTDFIDKVIKSANEKKAFVPSVNIKNVTTFSDTLVNIPVLPRDFNLDELKAQAASGSLPIHKLSSGSTTAFGRPLQRYKDGIYEYFYCSVSKIAPNVVNHRGEPVTGVNNVSCNFFIPEVGDIEYTDIFCYQYNNDPTIYRPFYLDRISGSQTFEFRCFYPCDFKGSANFWALYKSDVINPSGFDVTGKAPSISAEGVISYPKVWGETGAISIDSAPSLPLSIPKDFVSVPSITQDKAQSGVVENTDSKPDVKPEDANKDFERNKTKFMLPAIVKERFPFCIPFDIYNGILLLSAPAVAPVLTIPLKFDYQDTHFGQDLVFDFNNKDFQLPFAVLRWGEMLCFVIALAAATKKIVWG